MDQHDSLAAGDLAFDAGNSLARIQTFWAGLGAVHDSMTAIKGKSVIQSIQTFIRLVIAAVSDPTIGLQQHCWSQIFLAVPPIAWACCGAAETQDTFP